MFTHRLIRTAQHPKMTHCDGIWGSNYIFKRHSDVERGETKVRNKLSTIIWDMGAYRDTLSPRMTFGRERHGAYHTSTRRTFTPQTPPRIV